MATEFFRAAETCPAGSEFVLQSFLDQLNFNDAGLIPVIAQQYDSGQVLMMAWMNAEAIDRTLASGRMTYWSRSRRCFWRKGESSGHSQLLLEMRVDCDGDSLLCLVDQIGPACHTGRSNCFYFSVRPDEQLVRVNEDLPAGSGRTGEIESIG
ncbi:phosphoribosyl-AMP cyclohydrolase [Marinobacterium arenosum]|uniref:phosphoribosyl-AMP cyclohydrolase n=1 Tax=Marinobacterium arenosum TaxID=2862496 RepID=UPI001C9461C3|nr:phosphoribosyl-AMP cyclohydrolase [Marinobacterium arenosum]MBY4677334.1 phosphoribosyl-AMP cyclohydrolase [Marinobacterium arenosum]